MTSSDAPRVTAVVLCGGAGRRFGGDKTRALLAGRPVLDHVLSGLPQQWPVLCAGVERPTARQVSWVREDPPGGGPAAGVAAALGVVRTPLVAVLGGDMPYAAPLAESFAAQIGDRPEVDAVVARDGAGRLQPLLAAYRTDALRAAVPADTDGLPLMRLLDRVHVLPVDVDDGTVLDIDTPQDLDRARHTLDP